ncbi:mechanosensitive ion channel protein MscS [Tateyamaria omphalii]|uniref:mechanosensitive ion channel family protein n=1 Tax=Tateyamaria omphalii TaxID=299262 RepID=UPI00198E6CD5|nr:mechanosensitive ion channel family protein [Tateyamaria omphalii]GGX59348.1 mechanosensitive ion channel protein MscS [Tateyamaria omphalii]
MIRALLIILCLCAAPLYAQNADQPQGTIAITDNAAQDAAIAVRIRDILNELEGFDGVTVSVTSGIVTLRGTTVDTATADRLNELVGRVEGVVAIENQVTETTDVVARLNPAVERFQARMTQAVAMLPLIAVALLAFVLVLTLGVLLARARYPWDRIAPNAFIANIYRQVVRILFFIAGVVIALDILGATALLGTILGAAGIVGLAIGFAVRDTVENFIASIMLSIRQPFRPNDVVEIEGDTGKVIRLTSRATILLSFDGNHIRIPNATVFKSRIVNFSTNQERRFSFEIGVSSDADLAEVRQTAEETVAELPFILSEPAPMSWIERIGDGAIFLTVTGWIDQEATSLARAKGEALRLVKARIESAGIEVPDTTYRIQLLGGAANHVELAQPGRTESAAAPPPISDVDAADVTDMSEAGLDKLVDAERNDPEAPDLLTDAAPKE